MTEESRANAPAPTTRALPESPSLDWLRKQAKRRLAELRESHPDAQLADAQLHVAREYGLSSWRALKAHIDSLTVEGKLFEAAKSGDVESLRTLLDQHPEMIGARNAPYEFTLLHVAAQHGHLAAVDLLLERGADVNARERGDNTYAMHWAAAGAHLDVVRRLADAGGDVIGRGDDHELQVIGWASCWDGEDDAAHREVVDFLISRGAHHHIFSAIALDLPDEVRRIVAGDPSALTSRQSRNENNRTPLQFAVVQHRRDMVELLLELGADPLGVDGGGMPVAVYATSNDVDRPVMEAIHAMTLAEVTSADRGHRATRAGDMDVIASICVRDWSTAERLWRDNANVVSEGGALHILAKRGDVEGVRWLIEHGASLNARWAHWDSDVTPLHLAILGNHPEVARMLLDAGADPTIHDTKHDSDALGWAQFFQNREIEKLLLARSDVPRSGT